MSDLTEFVTNEPDITAQAQHSKIPWDEPAFSQRMLCEHLSQEHDAASRRSAIIDAHVDWIHTEILEAQPGKILDLGCGPGLYLVRLANLGHDCTGIDFGPSSIEYAREIARDVEHRCQFVFGDIRSIDYGTEFDLILLIFGELNAFAIAEARTILHAARKALKDGGTLVLELHTYEAVQAMGRAPNTWRRRASGLFSDQPYIELIERQWDEDSALATTIFNILDAERATIKHYVERIQAYSKGEYMDMLTAAGFNHHEMLPALADRFPAEGLFVITAR